MHHRFDLDGNAHEVWLARSSAGYRLLFAEDMEADVALVRAPGDAMHLSVDGQTEPVVYAIDGDNVFVHLHGRTYMLRYVDPLAALADAGEEAGYAAARAPMPGIVISVEVAAGQAVCTGEVLMVIESMKLETAIRAAQDGMVEHVHVKEGDSFDRDAPLVTLSRRSG